MNSFDFINACKICDSAKESEILSCINTLALRTGYKTTFLDHDTIYSTKWTTKNLAKTCFVLTIGKECDQLISFFLASIENENADTAFLVTKSHSMEQYIDFLTKLNIKHFIITPKIPMNTILIGHSGIVNACLTVSKKKEISQEMQRIKEEVKNIQRKTFLEMGGHEFSLESIKNYDDVTHILFNFSFSIIESPAILINLYQDLFYRIFPSSEIKLNWQIKYRAWYDFNFILPNLIKKTALSIHQVKMTPFVDMNFYPLYSLGKYRQLVAFNYNPDLDRFAKLLDRAKIYYNLISRYYGPE